MVKDLLLATNNLKKLKEIRQLLGDAYPGKILCASDFAHLPDPDETGTTFEENARLKANYYAMHTGLIALADDSGLVVDALDGRPGVYSARYAPTDGERIARLLGELANVPEGARAARFVCAMCLAGPEAIVAEVQGMLEGRIGHVPHGEYGFGYDPIFLVQDSDRTLAELNAEEKNSISHRGVAMKKIRAQLLDALK